MFVIEVWYFVCPFFPDTKAFVLKREMITQLTNVPTGIYNIEMCVLYSF